MATQAQADAIARAINVPREVIYGYMNEHNGQAPPSIAALDQWGSTPDWQYGIRRRDPNTGAWQAIGNGSINPNRTPEDNAANPQFAKINNIGDFALDQAVPGNFKYDPSLAKFAGPDGQPGPAVTAQGASGPGRTAMDSTTPAPGADGLYHYTDSSGNPVTSTVPPRYYDPATGLWGNTQPGGGGGTSSAPPVDPFSGQPISATSGASDGGINDLLNGQSQFNQAYYDLAKQKNDADVAQINANITDLQQKYTLAKNADDRAALAQQIQQEQFNKTFALQQSQELEAQRQNAINNQNTQRGQYANLATSLINAASANRGPGDYDTYLTQMNNGKDILSSLFGGQGRQAVEQAARNGQGNQPASVSSLLSGLGVDLSQFNQQPTTADPTAPLNAVNAQGMGQKLADLYDAMSAQRGGQPIAPNDPAFLQQAAALTGMSVPAIQAVTQQSHDYFAATGKAATPAQVETWVGNAMGGALPAQTQSAAPQAPATPSSPAAPSGGYGQAFADAYNQISAARGGRPIAANDPEYIQTVAQKTGLSPAVVAQVAQQGHSYAAANNGQGVSNQQVDQWVNQMTGAPQTATATSTAGQAGPGGGSMMYAAPNGGATSTNPLVQQMMGATGQGHSGPGQTFTTYHQPNGSASETPPAAGQGGPGTSFAVSKTPGGVTDTGQQTVGAAVTNAANPQGAGYGGSGIPYSSRYQQVVNPNQVNVADWDRMAADPSAKARAESYLKTMGQDPATYEHAMDLTRPSNFQGAGTTTSYKQPVGAFS